MIVPHDASRLHYIGVQSATFRIAGNGSGNFECPLSGPKRVRKVTFVTDDNTGVVSLDVDVVDTIGGSSICNTQDLFQAANTYVTVDEADLNANAQMAADIAGIAFEVAAGGAGAWGFQVQVLFSAELDANGSVCLDPQVSGLQ